MSLGGVCGSGVSYPRAVVSCVPLVGTLVTLYNQYKVEKELKQAKWNEDKAGRWLVVSEIDKIVALGLSNKKCLPVSSTPPSWDPMLLVVVTIHWEICSQLPQMKPLFRKQQVYATCALIHNILVLAGAVTLVALGILTGPGGWLAIALGGAWVASSTFYVYKSIPIQDPSLVFELSSSFKEKLSKGRWVQSLVDLPYKPTKRSSIDFLDPAMTSKPRLGEIDRSPLVPLTLVSKA